MQEDRLRRLLDQLRGGAVTRRDAMRRLAALGLAAPLATQLMALAGVSPASAQGNALGPEPARRGGGGALKLLYWQAPTLLNPHFATGATNQDASRIFYEPLAGWAADGTLLPVLAAEIPTLANGGLAPDGRSVTWRIKPGVRWHDGAPLTADDLVFNWEYARNPATAAVTAGSYREVEVVKVDDLTVRVEFRQPTPFWAETFVGSRGLIVPKHLFERFAGAASREAPANLRPVGTGAYRFVSFAPGDVLHAALNPDYHLPNRPFFDTLEVKGGGDATSAARAVLQTGDYDFAWNLAVEDDILRRLEAAGRGRVVFIEGGDIELLHLNPTDPNREVEGERSHPATTHPALADPAVRQAIGLLVDRDSLEQFIYGRGGPATGNVLNNPPRFRPPQPPRAFSVERANEVLEAAGWRRGADGIRAKDGVRLRFVLQTSVNAPRQRTQALIKAAALRAGIDVEVKAVAATVFFSSDVANPDTYTKFYADLQMFTTVMTQADPQRFMNQFVSWEMASRANRWQGRNVFRWRSADYDRLFREAEGELDPIRRAALFLRMNELVLADGYVIPLVGRPRVNAHANTLRPVLSAWDNTLWLLSHWGRQGG
jgi:peptide/nickel transport system substrate-binding protein